MMISSEACKKKELFASRIWGRKDSLSMFGIEMGAASFKLLLDTSASYNGLPWNVAPVFCCNGYVRLLKSML